jgi:hypothetical protein
MLTASLLLAAALAPADAPMPPPDAAVSDAGELPIPARKTARIT